MRPNFTYWTQHKAPWNKVKETLLSCLHLRPCAKWYYCFGDSAFYCQWQENIADFSHLSDPTPGLTMQQGRNAWRSTVLHCSVSIQVLWRLELANQGLHSSIPFRPTDTPRLQALSSKYDRFIKMGFFFGRSGETTALATHPEYRIPRTRGISFSYFVFLNNNIVSISVCFCASDDSPLFKTQNNNSWQIRNHNNWDWVKCSTTVEVKQL